jgi:uncharacterized membrane protein YccC
MPVTAAIREKVIQRAAGRCEYCGLSSRGQAASFHVDHIKPQAAGGRTALSNLALACVHCSLRKGARQNGRDPLTAKESPLFHPRRDRWNHHYRWNGCRLTGLSATGRATIAALRLNSHDHQIIRAFESQLGRHPPPGQQ